MIILDIIKYNVQIVRENGRQGNTLVGPEFVLLSCIRAAHDTVNNLSDHRS